MAMTEDRQTQSMIDFIEREGREKKEELEQAAQEEYDVEKMRLTEAEKNKIRANLEKRKKQVEIEHRVARANHTKKQRIRVMEERSRILDQLKENVRQRILAVVQDASRYRPLLLGLLKQAAVAVACDCVVDCRAEDEALMRQLCTEAQAWFNSEHKKAISINIAAKDLKSENVWGGIVVRSADGRITCDNTLFARFGHCFNEQLPVIRYNLLNEDAKI